MDPDRYTEFSERLTARLVREPEVLGLVALGSTAGMPRQADEWSDHDFFVVTAEGKQERFRNRLDWLPDSSQVVLAFRETPHGVKALYRSAHLVEFAVFSLVELAVARVNRFRVLFDRADVAARMRAAQQATDSLQAPDDDWLVGQFLTALLVGNGRFLRGERLSGRQRVAGEGVAHLLRLLERHVASEGAGALDDLDPSRRFEMVYPGLGREIDAASKLEVPVAAHTLLAIAVRELADRIPGFPRDAVEVVEAFISSGRPHGAA